MTSEINQIERVSPVSQCGSTHKYILCGSAIHSFIVCNLCKNSKHRNYSLFCSSLSHSLHCTSSTSSFAATFPCVVVFILPFVISIWQHKERVDITIISCSRFILIVAFERKRTRIDFHCTFRTYRGDRHIELYRANQPTNRAQKYYK